MPRVSRRPAAVRYFIHDGHRLSYEIHGSGRTTLVLLHGILLDANFNRRLASEVASHGYRVVLLDLLGHGRSDRPRQAIEHRMDLYAAQVVALLDHLGVETAVVGGVSLGADVGLMTGATNPERVAGLILEMPVLELAAPAAAMLFVPSLLTLRYLGGLLRLGTSAVAKVPRTGMDLLDGVLETLSSDPREISAVLHGVLLGPIAPTRDQRATIDVPSLVIGHRVDLLHPFSDAENLASQLPNARLVRARSIFEMRLMPARLTGEIVSFLEQNWPTARTAVA